MKGRVRTLVTVLCGMCLLSLAACNTTKGAGKDLQQAGEGIQNSAERHGAD
jgi:predicted small secreted protein